jgi:exodeoxyribonuclease VIII
MAKHLMVDMETMAVSPDAVILSLGAVHFDPFGNGVGDTLYFKLNLDDQDALKRSIDPNTLNWWSKQDPVIMEEAFSSDNRIAVADAVDQFHKFAWGCNCFWSHGATFDLVIIENLYNQLNRTPPWNFWQLRDTRTIFDLGHDPDMPKNSKHDALQDAIRQAVGVQNVYAKLGIKPKR